MVMAVIIVSFTPLFLVSGMILDQFSKSYSEKVLAHLEVLVRKHKLTIDSFLKERLANIRYLAHTRSYEELNNDDFLKQQLDALRQYTFRQYGGMVIEDIGIVGEDGVQSAYAGPYSQLSRAYYGDAVWFGKAMENDYYISDVFLGLRDVPHFIITVMRKTKDGRKWILRSTVDFMAFNSLVINLRIGETGVAFILNHAGELQTGPVHDAMPHEDILKVDTTKISDLPKFFTSGKKTRNDVYIVERPDSAGKQMIYVGGFLKDGEWILIFQQEVSDAFSDLRRAQYIAILIIIIGGIGIVSTAFIFSKLMIGHIVQADKEKEMMSIKVVETGKLASIGELVAVIAHEINNPVAIMVEEAGWMKDLLDEEELRQSKNVEEFQRSLTKIQTQGKRCRDINYKLLGFARKTDPRTTDFQINEMIGEEVGFSVHRAKYANIKFHTDLQENLPMIHASQTEIQQVMHNLINNAIDAMEKMGGNITIGTRYEGKNEIIVSVADDGPGIPQVNLTRIFDPFFTTKSVGRGTGLGLSICYGIIQKMGGDIKVRSEVGKGTVFYIHIPLRSISEEASTL